MTGQNNQAVRIDCDDTAAVTRANASYALARAYDRPDKWPADMATVLRDAFVPCGDAMANLARAMGETTDDRQALSVTHAKLFLGPFAVEAAPWASFYLDSDKQLMGPISRYAAEAYAQAGLAPTQDANDAPDHVTYELELMYFLAFQEATTGEAIWRKRQRRFWDEHLGQWLPQLADAVESAAADSPFYSRLAQLTIAFCAWQQLQLTGPKH